MLRKLATLALLIAFSVPTALWAATPVNINQADAKAIAKALDGIGQSRAQAIVDWREANGPFKKVEDLRHVKGIGKATIERNRSAIMLADASSPAAAPPREKKKKDDVTDEDDAGAL